MDSGVGRLVRHVENGLLEIFLTVYDFLMTLRMTEHEEICPGSFMFIYQFMKT